MAFQKITIGTVLAIVVVGMFTSASALSLLVSTYTISNTGNVKTVGVGVYWESSCINPVTSIGWGQLEPGQSKSVTIFVKNEGAVAVILSLTGDNWNPAEAQNAISITWNRENRVLNPGSVVQATITVSVSSNVNNVSNFSFDIIITGTEQT